MIRSGQDGGDPRSGPAEPDVQPEGHFPVSDADGGGACLRRWISRVTRNLLVQPFVAAMLAGVVGAAATQLKLSSGMSLVAVCPCMIFVPGPHILNGLLDLVRGRIPLGPAGFSMRV